MIELNGKYNNAKIFTDNADSETISQLTALLNQESIKGEQIRIMPDTHAGKGCVIGTTMTLNNKKVIPNLVGVDIGCFTGDTKVFANNSWIAIKQLVGKESFIVDSYDIETNQFVYSRAIAKKTRENAELVKVTYTARSLFSSKTFEVYCTPDHKFLVDLTLKNKERRLKTEWIEAKDLISDMKLVSEDHIIYVTNVEKTGRKEDVYCLTVEDTHSFLIEGSVVVHNCGMLATKIDGVMDLPKLDSVIRKYVPYGFDIHETALRRDTHLEDIIAPIDIEKGYKSLGSLGSGNHFIEVDIDNNGNHWLVIHTGSRHLGIEVCDYYQNLAYTTLKEKASGGNLSEMNRALVDKLTKEGRKKDIAKELKKLKDSYKAVSVNVPEALAYVEGDNFNNYIHDMKIAQEHAAVNRETIASLIIKNMGWKVAEKFTTVHNYIDCENMILRKGSVSAQAGEKLIIPINMRDGSLVCIGKGNPDWNYSAPHGAGRILSRSQAKNSVSMDEYKKSMEGIFSTCINSSTIDESPMVYKPIEEIMENVKDSVDVIEVIKPIYNFKAN